MFSLAHIPLPFPVDLTIAGETHHLTGLDACFRLNPETRTIHAELPPITQSFMIYGPSDFAEACGETPEMHAARVLDLLGGGIAEALQALCDGSTLPPPPAKIPREIPNWRAKAVLALMGLLPAVDAALAALPEPDRTVVTLAWNGDAKLARTSKTVIGLAAALSLTADQVDQIFIQAAGIEV